MATVLHMFACLALLVDGLLPADAPAAVTTGHCDLLAADVVALDAMHPILHEDLAPVGLLVVNPNSDHLSALQLKLDLGVVRDTILVGGDHDLPGVLERVTVVLATETSSPPSGESTADADGKLLTATMDWLYALDTANRHPYAPHAAGFRFAQFFQHSTAGHWMLLLVVLAVMLMLHMLLLRRLPDTTGCHIAALLLWVCVGGLYCCWIALYEGLSQGGDWLAGYILELGFSFENVLMFHIIAETFGAPLQQIKKALLVVMTCQIVFEFVFFMGLAGMIRSLAILPYFLAFGFMYCGVKFALSDDHGWNSGRTMVTKFCNGRLANHYDKQGERIFIVDADGKVCVTLLAPVVMLMVAADFMLEIDVVLSKIELIPHGYIAFSSSAIAAFAMNALYFIARDIFQRFPAMKYSVCLVFMYFGIEMVVSQFVPVDAVFSCAMVLAILVGFGLVLGAMELVGLTAPNCGARQAPKETPTKLGAGIPSRDPG